MVFIGGSIWRTLQAWHTGLFPFRKSPANSFVRSPQLLPRDAQAARCLCSFNGGNASLGKDMLVKQFLRADTSPSHLSEFHFCNLLRKYLQSDCPTRTSRLSQVSGTGQSGMWRPVKSAARTAFVILAVRGLFIISFFLQDRYNQRKLRRKRPLTLTGTFRCHFLPYPPHSRLKFYLLSGLVSCQF